MDAAPVAMDGGEDASLAPASCESDTDCHDASLLCDPLTMLCVACAFDDDCPEGEHCREGTCEPYTTCETSLDCVNDPNGYGICWETARECVECTQAADCEASSDCIGYRCVPYVPCRSSLDCTSPEVCDRDRDRCVECITDGDCKEGAVCGGTTCRQPCSSDNDCTPLGLLCYIDGGFCARCVAHDDCPEAAHCELGECRRDICRAEQWVCHGNAITKCNATGDGYTTPAQCAEYARCVETTTSASCEFIPDAGGIDGGGGAGGTAGTGGEPATGGDGGGGVATTGGSGGVSVDAGCSMPGLFFELDGDRVAIAHHSSFDLATTATIEAWIWLNAAPPPAINRQIFGKWANGAEDKQLGTGMTGPFSLYGYGYLVGAVIQPTTGAYALPTGAWVHGAFVADGAGGRVYVNGLLAGSVSTTGDFADSAGEVHIGGTFRDGSPRPPIVGFISEVRVSSTARYTTDFTPASSFMPDASTIGLWHLNEGSGTSALDSSSNGNHGMIQGATWRQVPCRLSL